MSLTPRSEMGSHADARSTGRSTAGSQRSGGTGSTHGSEKKHKENIARFQVLNPGVLKLHEEIRKQVEEFRHQREVLDNLTDRMQMMKSELRARAEQREALTDEVALREKHQFSVAVGAQNFAINSGAEERMTKAAVDLAERRAKALHGIAGAGDDDTLNAAELMEQVEATNDEGEVTEDTLLQVAVGIRDGDASVSTAGAEEMVRRAGKATYKQFIRSKFAEALMEKLGDLEGERLKQDQLASKALEAAGVKLGGHKTIRVVAGDRIQMSCEFHIPHGYTFRDLLADACTYWGVPSNRFTFRDPKTRLFWPLHKDVVEEMEHMPTSLESPTLMLVVRPAAAISAVMDYRHPNPVRKTTIAGVETTDAFERPDDGLENYIEAMTENTEALIHEMVRFLAFLFIFLLAVYLRRNVGEQFNVTRAVRESIVERPFGAYMDKTFRSLDSPEDFYGFMRGPLAESWFGSNLGFVAEGNKWVGAIRFRQLRIADNANCEITPDLTAEWQREGESLGYSENFAFVEVCHGLYSPSGTSTAAYGLGAGTPGFEYVDAATGQAALALLPSSSLATEPGIFTTSPVLGDISDYDGGGYIVELHANFTQTEWGAYVSSLERSQWIDAQSRAVVITFNWLNGNYGYLAMGQLLVEFADTGLVRSQDKIFITRLSAFQSGRSTLSYVFYFAAVLFVLMKLLKHQKAIRSDGARAFFSELFNFTEFSMCACIVGSLVIRVLYMSNTTLSWLSGDNFLTPISLDLGTGMTFGSIANGLDGVAVMFAFSTLFKFFEVNWELNVMWLTIREAFVVLRYYLLVYFSFFVAYALLTHTVFGAQVLNYSDVVRAIRTMLLGLLGDFNYEEVSEVSGFWAPVIFISFIVWMRFVLFNLLLAIFNDAYITVHKRREEEEQKLVKEGKFREPMTFAHVIGVFIPSMSPREQKRADYLRRIDEQRQKQQERLARLGISVKVQEAKDKEAMEEEQRAVSGQGGEGSDESDGDW